MSRRTSRPSRPRRRRTPLLVAAAIAASALAAVPATSLPTPSSVSTQDVSAQAVSAQAESAIVPVDIAPRLLSDRDYLARAAADRHRADALRAAQQQAASAAAAAAARQARADRAARLARRAEARRASRSAVRTAPSAPVSYGSPRAIARDQLAARGWSDQFGCLDDLWSRESGWRTSAGNASGAYGIPQALPGSKMASEGADWRTNPATQIRWGLGYISARYGSPCNAWAHFQSNNWY